MTPSTAPKKYFCTYFDRNYLVRALALFRSLAQHETGPYTIFAVCLDDISKQILEELRLSHVVPLAFSDVEADDSDLVATKSERTLVEYYWTSTPSILLHVLKAHPEATTLTYLDADLFFYSPSDPIYDEFANNAVLIHPHRFPERLRYLEGAGIYNVGLLIFRNSPDALATLYWWRARCIEWCYNRVEPGRMGDQAYLNDWPQRFHRVHVLEHIGAGVGPWNHEQYQYSIDPSGTRRINDVPLVFYHFHSLAFVSPELIVPLPDTDYWVPEGYLEVCLAPYLEAIAESVALVRRYVRDFSCGLTKANVLHPAQTFVAQRNVGHLLKHFQGSHHVAPVAPGWDAYHSAQTKLGLGVGGGLTHEKALQRDPLHALGFKES